MNVTIKYNVNSNEERDRIAMVLYSNLCTRPEYRDNRIGINILWDKELRIWVDDLSEMDTAKYVGLICTLISNTVRDIDLEDTNDESDN